MNSFNGVGRTTRDLELRYTPNGVPVTNFTLAINEGFGDDQKTYFIDMVAWRKTAENMVNYVKKGDRVGVSGKVITRTYENREGKNVKVTEILASQVDFLEGKKSGERVQGTDPYTHKPFDIKDDDLPF